MWVSFEMSTRHWWLDHLNLDQMGRINPWAKLTSADRFDQSISDPPSPKLWPEI